jgi:ribonuclease HI
MTNEVKQVLIYTDGACNPNPTGPGGYGVVLVYNGKRKEISGGFRSTTNNRMEIYAAIKALESLKEPCQVMLHSDSEYLVKAIGEGWAKRWKENNWWRNKQERAVNSDLWEKLLVLCETHKVAFVWVKGHAGHAENERCDYLSKNALKQTNLPSDEGYENRDKNEGGKVKITEEGQLCRKCSTPVVKRTPKKPKKTQAYYFEYYLYCPKCQAMYMVEEAKRAFAENASLF